MNETEQKTPAMSESEIVTLMSSSKSAAEWNANCDAVKKACGGYPEFWYAAIILSGVLASTQIKNGWRG